MRFHRPEWGEWGGKNQVLQVIVLLMGKPRQEDLWTVLG